MSIRLGELIRLVLFRPEVMEILERHGVDPTRYQSIIDESPEADIEIRTFQEFLDIYSNNEMLNRLRRLEERERRVLIEQKTAIVSLVYNLFNTIT